MVTCLRLFFTNSRAFLCPREYVLVFSKTCSRKSLSQLERKIFPNKPKKPPSSFFLYIEENRSRLKDSDQNSPNNRVYVAKLSTEWKELNEREKEVYRNKYKQLYEEYSKAMTEFENSKTKEQVEELTSLQEKLSLQTGKKQKLKRKKAYMEGKPKAPPPLLIYYMKSSMPSNERGRMGKDWLYNISEKWTSLPEGEKAKYITDYKELRRRYKEELDAWNEQREMSGTKDPNNEILDKNVTRRETAKFNDDTLNEK